MARRDAVDKAFFKAVNDEKDAETRLKDLLAHLLGVEHCSSLVVTSLVKFKHAANHRGFMGCLRGRLYAAETLGPEVEKNGGGLQ